MNSLQVIVTVDLTIIYINDLSGNLLSVFYLRENQYFRKMRNSCHKNKNIQAPMIVAVYYHPSKYSKEQSKIFFDLDLKLVISIPNV